MTAPRSALLIAWAKAWRLGLVSYDEVVDHTTGDDEPHDVAGLPGELHPVGLASALAALSRTDPDALRLVLPTPGDPRGLPGPGELTRAALTAGEAALCGGLGLVPVVEARTSGSGDTWASVTWHVYAAPPAPPEPLTVAEAEHDLVLALREATSTLARLDVARWRPDLAAALADLRRPSGEPPLPPGYDDRCHRVLARAATITRILELAGTDALGAAVTALEAAERDNALRPLATAARRAYTAAINAPLR